MPDMLVKLVTLPEVAPLIAQLEATNIEIRRANPSEKHIISEWVSHHFGARWASSCEAAIEQRPVSCYIAVEKDYSQISDAPPYDLPLEQLIGFGCYDVAGKGVFGPTGVQDTYRGRGIGTAILLTCLHTMRAEGYVYGIIGQAGPVEFYIKTLGATVIEGSEVGIRRRRLKGL